MTLPLLDAGALTPATTIASALLIGVAFGCTLERAGLGSATKLAGQFYLRDFTVFKVMFTAIITAMAGVLLLSGLGLLDLSRVNVPGTWLLPQLVGGVLFGVGFVMGGLCPGTSCVAAAAGRMDGLALIAGILGGTYLFGELFGFVRPLYEATPRGSYTLPDILGVGAAPVAVAITLAALAAFRGVAYLERQKSLQVAASTREAVQS